MEYLSKIEKIIIDYLCETDINSDELSSKNNYYFAQYNLGSFRHMLTIIFRNDALLKNVGIEVSYDYNLNKVKIFIMESSNSDSYILGDYNAYQRINFYLVNIPKFITQLEINEFIVRVDMSNEIKKNRSNFPFSINSKDHFKKTFEIEDTKLKSDFFDCLNYHFIPTLKLRDFKKNNYKTSEKLNSERENKIAKQNVKIAKSGLIISIVSAISSLIVIIITIINSQKSITIKLDTDQINSIQEYLKKEKNTISILDTTSIVK